MSEDVEGRPDLHVTKQVVSDIEGTVIQARHIHGGVHVDTGASPALHEEPLVVTPVVHKNCQVSIDPESRVYTSVSGSCVVEVLLEARSAQAVVLRTLHATVLSRRSPPPVQESVLIHSALAERSFTVDLDPEVPRVLAEDVDFPFTVTASDPEMFAIRPVSTVHLVRWQLELDWTYAGRRGTTVIPGNGNVFELYPSG